MNYWSAVSQGVSGALIRHQMWPDTHYVQYNGDGVWRANWSGDDFEMQLAGKEDGWEIYEPPTDWLQRAIAAIDSHDAGVLECRIAIGFLVKHLRSK